MLPPDPKYVDYLAKRADSGGKMAKSTHLVFSLFNRIYEVAAMSDIPWDGGAFPDGLAAALSDKSVSNPSVIDDLVGGFVQEVSDLADKRLSNEIDGQELDGRIKALCLKLGRIFSGKEPDWVANSWNTDTLCGLQSKSRAILASVKVNNDDDSNFEPSLPVAGLFFFLAKQTLSAVNAAYAGAENHPLPDVMSYVATTLLGTPSLEQATGSRDRS